MAKEGILCEFLGLEYTKLDVSHPGFLREKSSGKESVFSFFFFSPFVCLFVCFVFFQMFPTLITLLFAP